MDDINKLVELIVTNAQNYYSGQPCVDNKTWDSYVEDLKRLDPENEIFKITGWGYEVDPSSKMKHHYGRVNGITKYKTSPNNLLNHGYISAKLDGGGVELYYISGILVNAITRGDGIYGENAMNAMVHIAPNKLHKNFTGSILGEVVLSDESMDKYYPGSIAQRNIPNGFIKRDSVTKEDCEPFDFIAYKIHGGDINLLDRDEIFDFLEILGFLVAPHKDIRYDNTATYSELIEQFIIIKGKHYPLDGIVSSNYHVRHQDCSEGYEYIYQDEIAYKIVTETAEVEVTEISWNLTRTGRLVPTVLYKPVILSGAELKRALGHNARYIRESGIEVGSIIEVTRSGEVIPYILSIIEPKEVNLPKLCPSCGYNLTISGADLICDNSKCNAKDSSNLYHWIYQLGSVDNLGSSVLDKFIEFFKIVEIQELYNEFDFSEFRNVDGIGDAKVKVIESMLSKLKDSKSIAEFLNALNIKSLGWSSAVKFMQSIKFFDESTRIRSKEDISRDIWNVKGVNKNAKEGLLKNWDRLIELREYVDFVFPVESSESDEIDSDKIQRLKVCVTGDLDQFSNRKSFFKHFEDKIVESNAKDCDYFVTNNTTSNSSKMKEARKHNKEVLSELEAIERFNSEEVK